LGGKAPFAGDLAVGETFGGRSAGLFLAAHLTASSKTVMVGAHFRAGSDLRVGNSRRKAKRGVGSPPHSGLACPTFNNDPGLVLGEEEK
jgi:hypothetical protein